MRYCFIIPTLFFSIYFIYGAEDTCIKSTKGTDFWFGFMESRNYLNNHAVEIIITADESTNFTITFGPNEVPLQPTTTVTPGTPFSIRIPWTKQKIEAVGSEKAEPKGIHIKSEKPITVYAMNWDPYSSDVAMIYPVRSLGKEYFAMCYDPGFDATNPMTGSGRNSEFLVVATENNTRIEITPSKVTDKLVPKDSTFLILLNKGQVYQVQSQNDEGTDKLGQGDLTGSHIVADKPIAFFSGTLSTTIPKGSCCWDHLFEQIPPVDAWGKEYITIPLKNRQSDRFRVLAAFDNTTFQISGNSYQYLNRGEFREFVLNQSELKRIISDKPVLVAQYSQSTRVDSVYAGGIGDPFVIILNPNDQWINGGGFYSFVSPAISDTSYHGIKKQFVNVFVPGNETSVYLDGNLVQSQFKPFPGANFMYAQIETDAGGHRIINTTPNGRLQANIYGFGKWESYGYSLGFERKLKIDLGGNIEFFKGDTLLLCLGDTLILDAGESFDKYLWNNNSTSRKISVINEGWYWVDASTNDGCVKHDSVFVKKSSPQTNIANRYYEICQPDSVKLDAGPGYEKYIWQNETGDTLSKGQIIYANKTGDYRITVYNEFRCTARDTFSLKVFPVPEITILGDKLVCGELKTELSVSIVGTPEYIWNIPGNFSWSANSSDIVLYDDNRFSVKVEAKKWGDYELFYNLKTVDGCDTTVTFPVRFHSQPVNDFAFESDPGCENYSILMKFTGTASADAILDWDINGRAFLDTLDVLNRKYRISVGAKQPVTLPVSLIVNDKGCITESVTKPLPSLQPNFTMTASKNRGCDSLTTVFQGKILTSDQVNYLWTFDDIQTENGAVVTKKFNGSQFVKVNLTILNVSNQCMNSFTIDSMISIFPVPIAHIIVDETKCNDDSVSLYYANPIDSTLYFWSFNGGPITGFDNDSIRIKIKNTVESVKLIIDEFGCKSNIDSVCVKRNPQFKLIAENNKGCQPYNVEITTTSADKSLEYIWITDTLPYPNGKSNVYFFADTGRYDIKVVARSAESLCIDTLIQNNFILVYKKPYARFVPDNEVALTNNATIHFKNTSENATYYFWDFGDSIYSEESNPIHTYKNIGNYDARLISESEFGCTDTFQLVIQIIPSELYAPNAFRPESEIDENKTFMPVSAGVNMDAPFKLSIFNRWGEMVFESNSNQIPWEGKLKSGKNAPGGNYVWTLEYTDIQGVRHKERGQVLLIR